MGVNYRETGGVATVLLTGENGNAINPALARELLDAVRRARRDDAHVLVLDAVPGPFCVGGDISAFAAADPVGEFVGDLADGLHQVITALHDLDAVVVSVVRGVAAGAGVALAAAADLVLASESARFTLAYTRLGFSPDGGTALLTASLGLHTVLRLALLNPVLTAGEAKAAGLVSEVHPEDELDGAVDRVVGQLRGGSRSAQVATVRLVRAVATPHPEAALHREARSIATLAESADGREGVAAFLAKRPARFGTAG